MGKTNKELKTIRYPNFDVPSVFTLISPADIFSMVANETTFTTIWYQI